MYILTFKLVSPFLQSVIKVVCENIESTFNILKTRLTYLKGAFDLINQNKHYYLFKLKSAVLLKKLNLVI